MGLVISQLSVDAADPYAIALWWGAALGWVVEDGDDPDEVWVAPDDSVPSDAPGGAATASGMGGLLFVRVPEGKTGKNRLHLDVRPPNGSSQAAKLERLLTLGATPVDIGQGDVPWHVLADPEGNEFCLLRSTPDELAAAIAAQTD